MADLKGVEIGRYKVLNKIGEGGIAVVYKALDTHLETEVAIKFLELEKLSISASEVIRKRFKMEAQKMAQLAHASIVRVTDFGEHQGTPYLVMPYMSGGSLRERMGKPMNWREALTILKPISEALAYTHRKNLVHRDIKPSNILINDSGQPMLSDFGIVKILESEETMDLTGTSMGMGTAEYMAPEQADSPNVDVRADVYSVGVVLYEMLAGKKPYPADKTDTPVSIMIKHARDPLPPIKEIVTDLPDDVVALVERSLEKEPINRYPEMERFLDDLNKCLGLSIIPYPQPPKKKFAMIDFKNLFAQARNWYMGLSKPLRIGIPAASAGLILLAAVSPSLIKMINGTREQQPTEAVVMQPTATEMLTESTVEPTLAPQVACDNPDTSLLSEGWKEVVCQPFTEIGSSEGWELNEPNERVAEVLTEVYKEHLGVRAVVKQDMASYISAPVEDLRDFMVSVEGRLSGYSGNPNHEWGIVLKASPTEYYYFKLGQQNRYSFILYRDGKESGLINNKVSTAILPIDQTNRLTVIVDNYNYKFYANGELLGEIRDNRLLSGKVGLYLKMGANTTVDWEFDDFVIYQP